MLKYFILWYMFFNNVNLFLSIIYMLNLCKVIIKKMRYLKSFIIFVIVIYRIKKVFGNLWYFFGIISIKVICLR